MCGIWSLIGRKSLTTEQLQCFQKLKPRGPDHTTLHLYENYAIGHHWLALGQYRTKGQQPYYYHFHDYNYSVMVNGEIYNYREVRDKYLLKTDSGSDCAIVFPLFLTLEGDFQALNRELVGEYAIFIAREDRHTGVIDYYLSVDALSVIPAYYFSTAQKFGCASLKAGLDYCNSEIKRLDQGSFIHGRFDPSSRQNQIIESKRYVKYNYHIFTDEKALYKKVAHTLQQTVLCRLNPNRPHGCLLSGGLDSSLIAALASSFLLSNGQKLNTFSIGFEDSEDLKVAREVADYIESEHTEFVVSPHQLLELLPQVIESTESRDEKILVNAVPLYFIARKIAEEGIKVVLTGDGADESMMGNKQKYLEVSVEQAKRRRDEAIEKVHLKNGQAVERSLSHFATEVRAPYLDQWFVGLFYQISPELIVPTHQKPQKYLIRKSFETIFPELLPEHILWREKISFSQGMANEQDKWRNMLRKQLNKY